MTVNDFGYALLEHEKTLFSYSSRFSLEIEDRKDLVQETIMKALSNRTKFKEDTNLRGWLCTIMANTYINQYHRNVKLTNYKSSKSESIKAATFNQNSYESPEMVTRMNEIEALIDKLSDDLKEVLKMYLKGFKYREIAEELNFPIGTVKHKIFKAREILNGWMSYSTPLTRFS